MSSSVPFPSRFTGRAFRYAFARPGYPQSVLTLLASQCGLNSGSRIADIAAGTGIFTRLLLEEGHTVVAIEPNDDMRAVCEELRSSYPLLTVRKASAEHTGLPDASFDLVTVAQALHWFDPVAARKEFARILAPSGWCGIVYNHRHLSGNPFHEDYEKLLEQFGVDYARIQQRHLSEDALRNFFRPAGMLQQSFPNPQPLDLPHLIARVESSSYMPMAGHPRHAEMQEAIRTLFEKHQQNGLVQLDSTTTIYYGQIA